MCPAGIRRPCQNALVLIRQDRLKACQGQSLRRLGSHEDGCQELQGTSNANDSAMGKGKGSVNCSLQIPPVAMPAVPLAVSAHRTTLPYYSPQSRRMQARFFVRRAGKTRTSQISTGVGLPYGTPNTSSAGKDRRSARSLSMPRSARAAARSAAPVRVVVAALRCCSANGSSPSVVGREAATMTVG